MASFNVDAIFKVSGLAQVTKAFNQIGLAANNVNANFKRFGSDASRVLSNVTIAATALAGALGLAAKEFAEFEKGFTEVVTLLDSDAVEGITGGIDALRQGVIDLRAESGETFDNLNKGLFDLVSAGVAAGSAIETLGVAVDLALAGATNTAIAVNGITSALGAFGDEAGTAEEISQKFFTAQKFGKTTIEELAQSIGFVASNAAASGVSFEELLASVSAATVAGIRTRSAFTGLRAALSNIQKPTADAQAEAERLGIQFDAAALRSQGFVGLLKEVANSADFTQDSLIKLFGSIEGLNFAQSLVNDNFAKTDVILSALNDEQGLNTTFNDALIAQQSTLSFAFERLGGVISALSTRIGSQFAPALIQLFNSLSTALSGFEDDILSFTQSIADRFAAFINSIFGDADLLEAKIRQVFEESVIPIFNQLREAIGVAIAFITPIFETAIAVIDAFAKAIGLPNAATLILIATFLQLSGVIRLVTSSIFLLNSLIAFGATLFTRILIPIGAYILSLFGIGTASPIAAAGTTLLSRAIGILVFALRAIPFVLIASLVLILIEQFFGLRNVIENLPEIIKTFFKILGDTLLQGVDLFLQFFGLIGQAFDLFISKITGIAEAFGGAFSAAINLAKVFVQDLINTVNSFLDFLGPFGTAVRFFFDVLFTGLSFLFDQTIGRIIGAARAGFDVVGSIISAFVGKVQGIIGSIAGFFGSLFNLLGVLFTSFINGTFVQGFLGAIERIKSSFSEFFNFIGAGIQKIKDLFSGIVSFFSRVRKETSDAIKSTEQAQQQFQQRQASIQGGQVNVSGLTDAQIDRIRGLSDGGYIGGKGTGRSDSNLARLSRGEYVINAASVRKLGVKAMDMINSGIMPMVRGFADGGLVDALNASTGSLRTSGIRPLTGQSAPFSFNSPMQLVLSNGQTVDTLITETTSARLQRDLRRGNMAKASASPEWVR